MSRQITNKRIEENLRPAVGEANRQSNAQGQLRHKISVLPSFTFPPEKSKFVKTHFMEASPSGIELNKYWLLLKAAQKESLLGVINSFVTSTDAKSQELQEPETVYNGESGGLPLEILQQLTWEQKEALISLVESFGIEIPGQRISIEQYNKELDEAEAEFERGEFISHEEVVAMSKKWIHGQ